MKYPEYVRVNNWDIYLRRIQTGTASNCYRDDYNYYRDAGAYSLTIIEKDGKLVVKPTSELDKHLDNVEVLEVPVYIWYLENLGYAEVNIKVNKFHIEKIDQYIASLSRELIDNEKCWISDLKAGFKDTITLYDYLSYDFIVEIYKIILSTLLLSDEELKQIDLLQTQIDVLTKIKNSYETEVDEESMPAIFKNGLLAGLVLAILELEESIDLIKGENNYSGS